MELEHRFEVPVGIDSAWPSLLDMSQVADCFPGATLSSADGDTYIGSVKVKLGPIQLTYQGKARIVEADESAHRAVIEASGSASRSASTASMTVTATATALDDDHTAVNMATSLTITGRPAQFGRGVMVEVGNKILGQFADCLSGKLAASVAPAGVSAASAASGTAAAAATAANPAASVASEGAGSGADGDPGAGEEAGSRARTAGPGSESGLGGGAAAQAASPGGPAAEPGSAGGSSAEAAESFAHTAATASSASESGPRATAPTDSGPALAGPRHAASYTRSPEPIDLLGSAGPSILKRVVPLIATIILLIVVRAIIRGRGRTAD